MDKIIFRFNDMRKEFLNTLDRSDIQSYNDWLKENESIKNEITSFKKEKNLIFIDNEIRLEEAILNTIKSDASIDLKQYGIKEEQLKKLLENPRFIEGLSKNLHQEIK